MTATSLFKFPGLYCGCSTARIPDKRTAGEPNEFEPRPMLNETNPRTQWAAVKIQVCEMSEPPQIDDAPPDVCAVTDACHGNWF